MKRLSSFLIINPYGIGDVLYSTPLIRNIHNAFPEARIYYLCNKRTDPVIKNHPLIYKTFVYERDDFVAIKQRSRWRYYRAFLSFIYAIRKERIDVACDLSLHSLFSVISLAAGIGRRVGLSYKKRGFLLNGKVPFSGFNEKHVSDYYLDVLACIDIPVTTRLLEVFPDNVSREWLPGFLKEQKIADNAYVIGITPCGGQAFGKDARVRRWPAEYFSQLIQELIAKYHAKIFLFAGPKEKDDVQTICSALPPVMQEQCIDLTDCTLQELIALVDRCDLFIGNDTGPLRFANARNKKVIAFFGPYDEKAYGLYPYDHMLHRNLSKPMPCRPCYKQFRLRPCVHDLECLTTISVDEVLHAAEELLSIK